MKKANKLRMISGFLSMVMISTIFPISAVAQELEVSAESWITSNNDKLDSSEFYDAREGEERYIVSELLENRDQSTKIFRMNTGEIMVCEYDTPIHYQDENGIWQEYDNSLEEVTIELPKQNVESNLEESAETSDLTDENLSDIESESNGEEDPVLESNLDESVLETESELVSDEDLMQNDETVSEYKTDNDSSLESEVATDFATQNSSRLAIGFPSNILESVGDLVGQDSVQMETVVAFQNQQSDMNVQITKESRQDQMISVDSDDYRVNWGFQNSDSVTASTISAVTFNEEFTRDETYTNVQTSSEVITYHDIYESVDLECYVAPYAVKENIVLQNNAAQNTFRIHYQINGLIPEQAGTHGIYLKDVDGNVQFHISAPYMYDNSGAYSNALSMTIIEYDENEMVVELVADHEWLQDSERTYPVTIDPLFQTDQDRTTVDSAFYSSKNPSYCYGYGGSYWEGSLYVGNTGSGNYSKTRSVLKLNELPDLNTGDKIVAAYLSLYQMECSTEIRVDVHKATSSWNESQVNWNNQPSYDSNIAEYLIQKRSDGVETTRTFDITTMVQEWYNGEENNGVVLRSTAENSSSSCFSWYLSSKYTTYPSARPIFSLVYRNNKGLESYWSYSSASAGEAGTAYINNYSGNLVFEQTVLSTTGVNKPVTVSHYYNGYLAGKAYGTDTPGMPPFTGLGWKLNYSQTVFPSSEFGLTGTDASNYPYVYTDADGTDHYFYKKTENGSTTYLDEDGLGLELKINSSSTTARYVISDDEDHTLTFKSNGYLAKISEPAGAENTITSSSGAVTKITDGNGKYITLSAATSGSKQLQSLSTNYGQTVSYTYSNKKLTKITGYDGHDSTYTYDENGLLTSAEDAKGNKLSFTYTNVFSGNRVASVISTTENGTQISKTTFAYPNQYTTVVQNSNVDGEYGTNDDIISTYNFDTFGRTTSIHYESNGKDLGTECYQYTTGTVNSTASNIKKLNRITREHTTGVEVINPLDNHNMEYSTASWTGDGTYDSTQHYYGNRSMKLSSNGTDVKEEQTITLEAGKTYTLSGYVKMTEWSGNGDGASLKLLVGEEVYASDRLQTVTDSSIDGGWRRLSVTFTMPQGSSAATVQLFMNAESGVAYFDAIQLEEGKAPSAYNQLENAGLERAASDNSLRPEYWDSATLDYSSEDDHLVTNAYAGNKAFQLAGGPSINKQIFQDVPVVGTEEDTYVVSAWAKANAVPNDDNNHRQFVLAVRITYTDGKTLYKYVCYYNPAITDWQYVTASFTLSDNNSSTNKTVTAVAVAPRYYYEAQNMLIDNLQLIKEAVPTYTYDDDGNLIRVTDNAEQKSSMEYSNGNLTKSIDAKGYDYEYTYNTNHTLKKATSQTGVSYNYTYESKGRPTKLVVEDNDSNSSTKIETNVAYSSGKSYVASETDANGNTIDYTYVSGYGDLQTATTEIGNQTVENSYTYDSSTRLPLTTTQTVTSADGSTASKTVTNTYDQYHQLTALESPTTEYSFAYNDLGLMTSTSVGERTLATNTYTPAGLLTKSTYGNEFELGYVYDDYGNIIKKTFDGETAVEYFTDRSGTIVRAQDYLSGYRYENSFDGLGRTIRSAIFPLGNSIFDPLLTFEYGYDLNNNVTKYAVETPMGAYTSTYTYGKDNLLESAELDGKSYTYSYDAFNRLTSVAADDVVTQSYYYKQSDRGTGYSTYQISSETIGEDTYSYSYDEAGNITQIRGTDTAVLQWYEYDGFGQLVKEEDVEKHQTILYTYDDGGNILKKTDNGGNVLSSYAYEDTSWGDLLTKYNGQTITYDEIGNPLQYRDGITLTWKNGRRLATYQKGDTSISYDYDADGMRTKKTVGDTVSTYVYAGSQLTYETRGEEAFTYLYDANGIIRKLLYQSADGTISTYYYATNSRGDVIALYNSQGDKVVTYEYDAWGNVWSVGGSEAEGIGAKNPIRYRGYYYDVESGFYSLQSRYYDPEIGRFINADSQLNDDILGNNLFAYCGNNPVTRTDDSGHGWWIVASAIVGGAVSGVAKIVSNVATGQRWNNGVIGAVAGGVVYGAVLAATGNVWAAGFAGAATESAINQIFSYVPKFAQMNGNKTTKKVTTKNVVNSVKTTVKETVVYGTVSVVTGKIAGKIVPTNKGWFKPQKFVSSFAGKYAVKSELQSLAQGGLLFGYEALKYSVSQRMQGQRPIVTFFPDTQIQAAR